MSLDERIRADLRQTVESPTLRTDQALDQVRVRHGRGLVRSRVTREAVAIAVALSLFASVAVVVSWRNDPDRFRSTTTLRVATASTSTSRVFPLADPRRLALAADTRHATLASAHLSDDAPVDFRATFDSKRDLLTLAAVAPSALESRTVTREWVSAFAIARRADAIRVRRALDLALNRQVAALHDRLNKVDAELKKIHPGYYRYLRYHPPYGSPFDDGERAPSSPAPSASVRESNLFNERVQLLTALARIGAEAARRRMVPLEVPIVAKPIAPAVRVDTSSPATVPILVGWAIGLLVVLAATILVYRRRVRSVAQVSA
jgi:hypothetical protein